MIDRRVIGGQLGCPVGSLVGWLGMDDRVRVVLNRFGSWVGAVSWLAGWLSWLLVGY